MTTIAFTQGRDWESRRHGRKGELVAAWSDFLGRVPWELFATLTFDPKRVYPVDRVMASREAFWWCNALAHMYRVPAVWAYAPERGATGLWHAHALLQGTPKRIGEACAVWKARNGHIDVRPVSDGRGITMYASKSAAATGEIVWSDTCRRFAPIAQAKVQLYPGSNLVDFGTANREAAVNE